MNTSHVPPQPGQQHRRKIHYIDYVLQKRLLIALVVLEVVLLCIAGAVLYFRLNVIVDENLYRIHFADQPSMLSVLLKESLLILGGLVAVNLAALFVADRIWANYVNGIMHGLRGLLARTLALDLRPDAELPQRHKVLELALAWRHSERMRYRALREVLERAEALVGQEAVPAEEYRACLLAMRAELPAASARRAPAAAEHAQRAHPGAA